MTTTTNGHRLTVTDSGHERMSVSVTGNPVQAPDRAGSGAFIAHVRAIPDDKPDGKRDKPSKIRNFVSLHGGEVKADFDASDLLTTTPHTPAGLARTLWPADGRIITRLAWTVVRVFQLAATALAYTICHAVGTDKRAAVALALTLLTFTTALVVALITN